MRKLSVYFGPQKVLNLQVFNVRFEQNIESQHQCPLAYVDGIRTTRPERAIRGRGEIDVTLISDEKKEMKGNQFNENLWIFFKHAAL